MTYSIDIYSSASEKAAGVQDLNSYYELRKRVFTHKIGPEQEVYYGSYPTEHDMRANTIFLLMKTLDPETGKNIIFGGRRIVLPENGLLPFERKHEITRRKEANRFEGLSHKNSLDITDVLPAVKVEKGLKYAEAGAFAIDQEITRRLFGKEEYVLMREDIYRKTVEAAKDAGIDILVIEPGRNNLRNQHDWLKSSGQHEFRRLGGNTRALFTNPFPKGQESELLLINISNRFKLTGPESILRFNQSAARTSRNAAAGR